MDVGDKVVAVPGDNLVTDDRATGSAEGRLDPVHCRGVLRRSGVCARPMDEVCQQTALARPPVPVADDD